MSHFYSQEQRQTILLKFKGSGQSVRAFAKSHHLHPSTLYNWISRQQ